MSYPHTQCLNPRIVVNPYTFEVISTPCGHCKACLLNKSQSNQLKCTLESLKYSCTWFITLTYANEYLPKAVPVYDDYLDKFYLMDSDTGEVLVDDVDTDLLTDNLFEKLHSDYVPYLSKVDLQQFFKRLRKHYAKKEYKCKLRYFAVGEYGPKHFRPHYHILLWFEKPQRSEKVHEVISEKWPFGRIDVQKAKGDCSQYVAGYANSFSFVPPVLQVRKFRPFSVHSTKLGEEDFSNEFVQVYETPLSDFIRRSYVNNGRYSEFNMWRSYLTRYFPRCVSYADKTSYRRLVSYKLYRYASVIPQDNIYDLADKIFDYVERANYINERRSEHSILYDYFKNMFPNCEYYLHYSFADKRKEITDRIYRELLISKRFCHLSDTLPLDGYVGLYQGQYSTRDQAFLYLIERFYSQYDNYLLRNFYEKQTKYFNEVAATPETVMAFYSPFVELAQMVDSVEYKRFCTDIDERFNKAVKHKYHNDANKLLF